MSKHTQGPWSIWNDGGINNTGHYDGYLKTDIKAGSNLIHVRQSVAGNTFLELSANVRLIAAAPQMLSSLILAEEWLDVAQSCVDDERVRENIINAMRAARDAISSACGE